ncbi:MAG TPA: MATE family efflux transporter [Syntrophomonadaceae bacterium]|nr:MATE family efflux transporter [Syntrophomonadaceae bacterium]
MIRRKILSLAWPAVCEMMLYMLLDFVDVAFVGRLGAQPLAAVGLGAQIYFSLLFIFSALSAGATALIARAVGSRDPEKAGKTAGHALSLAVLVGIAVTVSVYLFTDAVVGLFHFEVGVQQLAAVYIKTTGSVAAFGLVLFISNGIFRGAGLTKIPFYIAALTNVVNIVGDYVLIFGKWGFPALGVRGAALATASAQVIGCVVMVVLLLSGATMVRVRPRDFFHLGDRELTGVILKLSAPAGVEEALMSLGRIIGSFMLSGLGTVPFAAHQVVLTAESLSYMPGYGFAVAATSLVGQNLGARKPKQAYLHGLTAARLALVVMGVIALIFLIFPSVIIRIFTRDPQVVGLGVLCLRIAALEQPSIALEMVLAGALRGAGDTRTPAVITVLSTWLLRIPLMYISIYIFHWGLPAIWIITVIDWLVRALLVIIQFRRGKWQQIAL